MQLSLFFVSVFSRALPGSVRLGTKLAWTCSKTDSEILSPRKAFKTAMPSPLRAEVTSGFLPQVEAEATEQTLF